MKATYLWLKRWADWLFAGLATILLTLITGGWWWRRQKAQLASAKDEATIAKATSEIGRLKAIRTAVAERVGEKDEAITAIDEQILEQRRKVAAAGMPVSEGMTSDELEEAYRRILGR